MQFEKRKKTYFEILSTWFYARRLHDLILFAFGSGYWYPLDRRVGDGGGASININVTVRQQNLPSSEGERKKRKKREKKK